ncbi:hypothetical protein [Arenibacter catalasegens]|nr:hypothetical protein [Arenibacter catalasegens]
MYKIKWLMMAFIGNQLLLVTRYGNNGALAMARYNLGLLKPEPWRE